jgi:NADPH2:quinone reductase
MSTIKESTGVVIKGPNDLAHSTIAIGKVGDDEVIVKVHSAPINPADLMLCAGMYPAGKTHPCTAGLEGSGVVVEAGAGAEAQALMGKRVAFFATLPTQGSWGDFCHTNAKTCFPLLDAIDFEQGACALINPLTVEAMMIECDEKGYKTIVHAGASSQLGRMMIKIAPKHNVTVINLVRREENVKLVKEAGAQIVIDTTAADWEATMAAVFAEHKPQAFFDPVCGEVGSKVVAALPPKSNIYTYGALGGFSYNVAVGDLIFQDKKLQGFWLNHQIADPARGAAAAGAMMTHLAAGVYKTEVAKRFKTSEFAEALEYYKGNMTAGKALFQNPNF